MRSCKWVVQCDCSVTGSLDYLQVFGLLKQWKFAQWHIQFAQIISKFWQLLNEAFQSGQSCLTVYQSDEISTNLVTLATCGMHRSNVVRKWGEGREAGWKSWGGIPTGVITKWSLRKGGCFCSSSFVLNCPPIIFQLFVKTFEHWIQTLCELLKG